MSLFNFFQNKENWLTMNIWSRILHGKLVVTQVFKKSSVNHYRARKDPSHVLILTHRTQFHILTVCFTPPMRKGAPGWYPSPLLSERGPIRARLVKSAMSSLRNG
jgi:hypothetical protein